MALNARIIWAVLSASGAKKKGGGKWSLKDFMMQRRQKRVAAKSPEDLLAMAVHLNKQLGGKDLRDSGNDAR